MAKKLLLEENRELIARLRWIGISYREIARSIGNLSWGTIRSYCNEHNIVNSLEIEYGDDLK